MAISEPTTLLSNAVLAALAAALGARLHAAACGPQRRATRLWAAAFLAGAAAALAGAIVHGFGPSLPPAVRAPLWKAVLAASGLACALLVAASGVAALRGTPRRAWLAVAAFELAVYLALVARSDDIRLAASYGALAITSLFFLGLASARRDRPAFAALVGALALSAGGIALQQARAAGPGPFNHNDVCHALQTAALWPFYRAGLRLRDRPA